MQTTISCGQCGKGLKFTLPDERKTYRVTCKSCGHTNKVKFDGVSAILLPPEQPAQPKPSNDHAPTADTAALVGQINTQSGMIRVRKGWFLKLFGKGKSMPLKPGSNIIGRYDSTAPSDFNLSDRSVSRRSLEISVEFNPKVGYTFKLTVHKAANPVLHNGRRLSVNEAVELRFNDTIKVGKTLLEFIPIHY